MGSVVSSVSGADMPASSNRSSTAVTIGHRATRRAISLAFALQGFVIGSWALHVPFLVERLGITKSAMGLVIVMFGLGSVLAMALLAVVLPRTGSRLPAGLASALTSFFVLALAVMPDYATTLWIAPLLSAVVGVASVALNAQGVEIERRSGAKLMSSFHNFWSMGILIGSILGGLVADAVGPLPCTPGSW